jgi:FRG domain
MLLADSVKFTIEKCGDIASVEQLLSAIFEKSKEKQGHKFWYRGLSDCCYKLIPSVGREQRYAGRWLTLTRDQEKSLLHRFRRRAYPYVGRTMTAGEAIFLARHHGLPTRLLDWTANALFALSFACAGDHTRTGRVWAMRRRQGADDQDLNAFQLANYNDEEDLFKSVEPCSIRIIYPFYNSPRLLAQDGAFTIHSPPQTPLEDCQAMFFEKENLDIEKLYRWNVPAEKKTSIVEQLSELGVTQRSMFPDLDGVARSLWETEVLWNGTPKPDEAMPRND